MVALAHLAAIQARQRRHLLVDHHVRQREVLLAIHVVEALGEVARHLDVLDLVTAHRYLVGLEDQDVGGHQHRIHEQAGADACVLVHAFLAVLVHRRLVGVRAVEDALAGDGGQEPHQLGGLADVALAVEPHVFRVQATGQPAGRDLQGRALGALRVLRLDQAVQVGQEEEALDPRRTTGRDGRTDGANVVAQVGRAGGGDAGKDSGRHDCVG